MESNFKKHPAWALFQYGIYLICTALILLLILEGGLRLVGYPRGYFDYRASDGKSLFRPDSTMHLVWDLIPYTIETNTLGFRGAEITLEKPEDTTRIIALGDSITQGFYVDNLHTYPALLEDQLKGAGHSVEVINCAIGDISIDRQIEMYTCFCEKLGSDIVILTFVTNDIDSIRGKSRESLLHSDTFSPGLGESSEWMLFGQTAIGEIILDQATRRIFERYREHRDLLEADDQVGRYDIEGGDAFEANAQIFLRDHAEKADGIAGYETYTAAQLEDIKNYLYVLDHFHAQLEAEGVQLMVAYFPDYPEIYLPDWEVPLGGMLRAHCAEEGIPFCDLLPLFRGHGDTVLHLAPLDFHPNPAGNGVMADAFSDFLVPYLSKVGTP